jgi:hypothetical protein
MKLVQVCNIAFEWLRTRTYFIFGTMRLHRTMIFKDIGEYGCLRDVQPNASTMDDNIIKAAASYKTMRRLLYWVMLHLFLNNRRTINHLIIRNDIDEIGAGHNVEGLLHQAICNSDRFIQ